MTLMKMSKKKSSNGNDDDVGRPRPTHRAWKLLRLALLWARKGGVFRRRLMMKLRIVPQLLKSSFAHLLMHMQQQKQQKQHQYYFERQLSFDKTPIFPTLKTKTSCSRSSSMCFINNIPCLNAPLVLDYFDDDQVDMIINNHEDQSEDRRNCYYDDDEDDDSTARQSVLIKCDEDDDGRDIIQDDEEKKVSLSPASASNNNNLYEEEEEELEESVDIKADEFIAKFYQQMKLQRQISYLHYTQNLTC